MAEIIVSAGESVTGAVVTTGDTYHVNGTDTNALVAGRAFIWGGGLMQGTAIASGGTIDVLEGGTASNAVVQSGGMLLAQASGIISGTTVSSGGRCFVYGSAFDTVVHNGGAVQVSKVASGMTISGGGTATVVSGASLSAATVASGATLTLDDGASATGGTVSAGATVSGLVLSDSVTATGEAFTVNGMSVAEGVTWTMKIESGGSLDGITLDDDTLAVHAGGMVSDATVGAGATMMLYDGTAANVTVSSGGTLRAYGSTLTGSVVRAGAEVWGLTLSTAVTGVGGQFNADGVLVEQGAKWDMTVAAGGIFTSAVVGVSGFLIVDNGGVVSAARVNSGGAIWALTGGTVSGGTVLAGGRMDIEGTLRGGFVKSGGEVFVSSGGTTLGTIVHTGGRLIAQVEGTAQGTTLGAGAVLEVINDGVARNTLINSGGVLSAGWGGAASGSVIRRGGTLVAEDLVTGTVVSSGGTLRVGGIATNTKVHRGAIVQTFGTLNGVTLTGGAALSMTTGTTLSGAITLSGAGNQLTVFKGAVTNAATLRAFDGGDVLTLAGRIATTATLTGTYKLNLTSGDRLVASFQLGAEASGRRFAVRGDGTNTNIYAVIADGRGTAYTDFLSWRASGTVSGGAGTDTLLMTGATRRTASQAKGQRFRDIEVMDATATTGGVTLIGRDWAGTTLLGGAGADTLTGGAGADILKGGAGADILTGGAGADTMIGGAGADTYIVDNVRDVVTEGLNGGIDLVRSSVTFTLSNNVEKLTLMGSAAIKGIGNGVANVLTGNSAANILDGRAGNDTLNGGGGNDVLIGGRGADLLTGGLGADRFRYGARTDGGDTIIDFNRSQKDRLEFSASAFGNLPKGQLDSTRFQEVTSGGATKSGTRFVYNSTEKALYFDSDGKGSAAAVRIATFSNGAAIRNADIFVV